MENRLKIIIENCPQNHKCPAVKVCPVGALSQKEFNAPTIDYDKCIKCGKCSNFCPKKALVLECRYEKLMYYTYMIRCEDNSIYTGITNNLEKRINEHLSKNGAKYTKSHNATKLESAWKSKDKSLACKLEYQIKQLNKQQKENLINGQKLSNYLSGKVDCRRYKRI